MAAARNGSQTQSNSESMTRKPGSPKKRRRLKGDASMGLNGAKNLCSLSGHKIAAPCPAFVHVSRRACDAAQMKR